MDSPLMSILRCGIAAGDADVVICATAKQDCLTQQKRPSAACKTASLSGVGLVKKSGESLPAVSDRAAAPSEALTRRSEAVSGLSKARKNKSKRATGGERAAAAHVTISKRYASEAVVCGERAIGVGEERSTQKT